MRAFTAMILSASLLASSVAFAADNTAPLAPGKPADLLLFDAGSPWQITSPNDGNTPFDGLPDGWTLHGVQTMDGRVPTFAITHERLAPREASARLGEQGFATWSGNYYAVETMKRLGLDDGAVRVGIVHYNTADEVDRLLDALATVQ